MEMAIDSIASAENFEPVIEMVHDVKDPVHNACDCDVLVNKSICGDKAMAVHMRLWGEYGSKQSEAPWNRQKIPTHSWAHCINNGSRHGQKVGANIFRVVVMRQSFKEAHLIYGRNGIENFWKLLLGDRRRRRQRRL